TMNEEMPIYDVFWDDIPEEELSNVLEATEASDNCNSCNKRNKRRNSVFDTLIKTLGM
ncbi:hypothetical protein AC249_AIPGENE5521, partial [Exaiptasia diaphana]